MSLQELMEYFFRLYGRRNRVYLFGLEDRHRLLALSVSDLQQAIRKQAPAHLLDIALARVVSRIFCVAEHFWSLPLVTCLARKYPTGCCSYCQQKPCVCIERQRDAQLAETPAPEQLQWSLAQWAEHLRSLYGTQNKKRGVEYLVSRLFAELGEMLSLQMLVPRLTQNPEEIEQEFALELGDVLAWLIAVANFLERDVEMAVLNRFGQGCWNCRENPCVCRNFNFALVDWTAMK